MIVSLQVEDGEYKIHFLNLKGLGNVYDDNSFSSSEYDKVDDLEYYKETVRNKVRDHFRRKNKVFVATLNDQKVANFNKFPFFLSLISKYEI